MCRLKIPVIRDLKECGRLIKVHLKNIPAGPRRSFASAVQDRAVRLDKRADR